MAFAKGKESSDSTGFSRYVGVAPVTIVGINPSIVELSEIYNSEMSKAPEYKGQFTAKGPDGKDKLIDYINIVFYVKTIKDISKVEIINSIRFMIANEYRYNKDFTKIKVINKYGETTWLTKEDFKNKTVPQSQSFFSPDGMRAAYRGEETLVMFLKQYLGISNRTYLNTSSGEWENIDNLSDAEAYLDKIKSYFTGDITEIKDIIKLQPENKVKALFGVRHYNGNDYQTIYTGWFMKNGARDYTKLEKTLTNDKTNGRYSDTEFFIGPLKKYEVEATDFESKAVETADTPW